MKKTILFVLSIAVAIAASGCSIGRSQYENVDIDAAVEASTLKLSDYKNDLEGLEKYLKALNYIPENAVASDMMYNVIGAVNGHRFIYTLNKSQVFVELYEYNPDALNEEAKRVINEVRSEGKFYVFNDKRLQENAAFEATLSDNGKYLLVYTDQSASEDHMKRKTDFTNVVKGFYNA